MTALPDITCLKDLGGVPAALAPYVQELGTLLFVFCDDVTGHLSVSCSPVARPGTDLVCRLGPRGSLGTPGSVSRFGARVYHAQNPQ